MEQLGLDLIRAPDPGFDNFIAGRNAEALARIEALARGDRQLRLVYLWGESGTGKSHLLRALGGLQLVPDSPASAFDAAPDESEPIVSVDDCERLDDGQQTALFHLYNRVLARPHSALVCAGSAAPIALPLREDLRTRLGYGLVIRLLPLSDEHCRAALQQRMRDSGIPCTPELIDHLLRHRSRDLGSLLGLLFALERYALERQRSLTLPLLREFEQRPAAKLPGS
jgi:DnaA family protein